MYQIQLLRKFWGFHIVVKEERARFDTSAAEKGVKMVVSQDPVLIGGRKEIYESLLSHQEYTLPNGKFVVRIVKKLTTNKPLFGGRRNRG